MSSGQIHYQPQEFVVIEGGYRRVFTEDVPLWGKRDHSLTIDTGPDVGEGWEGYWVIGANGCTGADDE